MKKLSREMIRRREKNNGQAVKIDLDGQDSVLTKKRCGEGGEAALPAGGKYVDDYRR